MTSSLRPCCENDVPPILAIAEANRGEHHRYQMTFWRRAAASPALQVAYLNFQLVNERVVGFVHESDKIVDGFVFASILPAPPVYNPGGPVAIVDDFAVREPSDWPRYGASLIRTVTAEAHRKGAVLAVVVTGHHEEPKRDVLTGEGYSLASEWHVGEMHSNVDQTISVEGVIRQAGTEDLPTIVELCDQRRVQYQAYQPVFWRNAADAREKQRPYLERTLRAEGNIAIVHEHDGTVDGFLIGQFLRRPPVLGPVGTTCLVDDFCVAHPDLWTNVGEALIRTAKQLARDHGAEGIAVICGHRDQPKRAMLGTSELIVSSEWWVRKL